MIDSNIISLGLQDTAFIIVSGISHLNPYKDMDEFTRHARAAFFSLPPTLLLKVAQFRAEGNQEGFLLIRGLPTDGELPDTPVTHTQSQQREWFLSEYCLTMLGSHLGELYGFAQESEGSIFNNIRPTCTHAHQQSSESSGVFLELHTEIAFHEFRPDFLLLYCLRQDRERVAKTGIASIRSAMQHLSAETLTELRKPNFSFAYDFSFGNESGRSNALKQVPILEGPLDDPYMTYDSDLITPLTDRAQEALRDLDDALRETMVETALEPGDLILVDNRRTSHSRTHFKAHYDGKDRWLQRAFIKQDMDAVKKRLPGQVPIINDIF